MRASRPGSWLRPASATRRASASMLDLGAGRRRRPAEEAAQDPKGSGRDAGHARCVRERAWTPVPKPFDHLPGESGNGLEPKRRRDSAGALPPYPVHFCALLLEIALELHLGLEAPCGEAIWPARQF